MHFYYSLYISSPTAHNSKLNIQHSKIMLSPIQELEPGAMPCRGGRCAARYSHEPQATNTKNTLIMIMQVPAEGVEPSQRALPGAGKGLSKLRQF